MSTWRERRLKELEHNLRSLCAQDATWNQSVDEEGRQNEERCRLDEEIEELESKLSEALAYFQDDRETKQQDLKIVQAKKNIADSKEGVAYSQRCMREHELNKSLLNDSDPKLADVEYEMTTSLRGERYHEMEAKKEQKYLNKLMSEKNKYEADLTVETSFIVTNSEKHFTWNEYGINIYLPQNSLPKGVVQCSIHIKASAVMESFQLPQDTHLVSAVYSIKCIPKCQFSKHLTLEIQHCAKRENNEKLYFVKSTSGSNSQMIDSGENLKNENILYSHFPRHTSYGFVELDKFCKFGVVQRGETDRLYRANIYHYGFDSRHHKFHFNIVWDTKAHNKIISEHYARNNMLLQVDQIVEFEESQIQLDIPFPSTEGLKATSNDDWRILSLSPPLIKKVEVDNFDEGKRIPSCQLLAKCKEASLPTDLMHSVQLRGAKDPYNAFLICVPVMTRKKKPLDNQGLDNEPGLMHPRIRTCRVEMSFTTLLRELSSKVSAHWEKIGHFLGLETGLLDIIKHDNPNQCQKCFSEMIKLWFRQQVDPPPSWSAIIEALDILGHKTVAQSLREKYL